MGIGYGEGKFGRAYPSVLPADCFSHQTYLSVPLWALIWQIVSTQLERPYVSSLSAQPLIAELTLISNSDSESL